MNKSNSRGDVKLFKRQWLKWEEAIEAALMEANAPLDAEAIGQIFVRNQWLKHLPPNLTDAVSAAVTRVMARGNKPDIEVLRGVGQRRRFWLRRRGPAESEFQPMAAADGARNRAVLVGQQVD